MVRFEDVKKSIKFLENIESKKLYFLGNPELEKNVEILISYIKENCF